jgi:phage tail-like protein
MATELPLVGFHFEVEIQDKVKGYIKSYFLECSGLGSEHEVIEHKLGTQVQKIPGRLKWENITLKGGITSNMDIWKWRQEVEDGKVEGARRNGSVIMLDQELKPVARWDFERAFPLKASGPQLKSDSNDLGIQELVITHEGIHRVQ